MALDCAAAQALQEYDCGKSPRLVPGPRDDRPLLNAVVTGDRLIVGIQVVMRFLPKRIQRDARPGHGAAASVLNAGLVFGSNGIRSRRPVLAGIDEPVVDDEQDIPDFESCLRQRAIGLQFGDAYSGAFFKTIKARLPAGPSPELLAVTTKASKAKRSK